MDERIFIEQKQDLWKSLSESLDQARRRGVKSLTREQLTSMGAQYREVVSDLSFVRSQGASDDLVIYLNELSGRAHGVIYASRSARLSGVTAFLFREFPALFRTTLIYTIVATFIFFAGWGVSYINPEIRDMVMPQKMSKPSKGAKTSSPLADIDPALVSSFIMTNNIKVGIIAFAGGVTAGAYTVYELLHNGLVIGAVATKAAPVMGMVRFWSLILPHGVIELMAIFICGGAGLMMGAAIIAPGNLRRSDALRLAAGTALKLFAGAVMFFIIAGIIEGFITPSVLSDYTKLIFAGVTALALIAYLGFAGREKLAL